MNESQQWLMVGDLCQIGNKCQFMNVGKCSTWFSPNVCPCPIMYKIEVDEKGVWIASALIWEEPAKELTLVILFFWQLMLTFPSKSLWRIILKNVPHSSKETSEVCRSTFTSMKQAHFNALLLNLKSPTIKIQHFNECKRFHGMLIDIPDSVL